MPGGLPFKVAKVEQLVFLDRTTHLAAVPIEIIAGIGHLAAGDGVLGVQIPVLEVLIRRTMQPVAAAFHHGVELPSG